MVVLVTDAGGGDLHDSRMIANMEEYTLVVES